MTDVEEMDRILDDIVRLERQYRVKLYVGRTLLVTYGIITGILIGFFIRR